MKKILCVVAVVATLIICDACSQEQHEKAIDEKIEKQEAAFKDLRAEIAALNAQFGLEPNPASRGRGFRRFWKIFGSDLLGGIFGCRINPLIGFFCGVSASITAATATEPETEDQLVWRPIRTTASYVSSNTTDATLGFLDSLGYYHNQVICDLYEQYGENLFTFDELTKESVIMQAIQPYVNENVSSYATIAVTEKYNIHQLLLNMDEDNLDETFEAAMALAPSISNELSVVKNYCATLQYFESDAELLQYSVAHDNLVRASDIDADAQALILAGSAIGGNSAILWDKVPFEDGLEAGDVIGEEQP